MAKRIIPKKEYIEVETVYSKKYQCLLTKKDAIFDKLQDSWINEQIERINKK